MYKNLCVQMQSIHETIGPLGHLLDTAKRVGITIAEKMAVEKLQFH